MLSRLRESLNLLCGRCVDRWAALPGGVRVILGVGLAYLIWVQKSWAVQDVVLWLGVLCALARFPAGFSAWRCAPGFLALSFLAWAVVQTAFVPYPRLAAGDMAKNLDTVFFALAIPALVAGSAGLWTAMACSACAFTAVVAYDLVRLAVALGPDLMSKAHAYEPFIWTHSNISAMAAGMAAIVLLFLAWRVRARVRLAACAVAGGLVNLVYLGVIGSRGPQVAFAGALLVILLVVPRGWKWRVALALLAAVVGLSLFAMRERINPRFAEVKSLSGLVDRDKAWLHTWELAKARPVVGYGYGDKVFMKAYHTPDAPFSPHRFRHPHQHFIAMLFSFGAVGLAVLLAMWGALVFRLLRTLVTTGDPSQRALACALVALLAFIHIFALADCPTSVTGVALVWLVPAALVATAAAEGREQ